MSTDDLREKLAEAIRAAEPYIYADPADARELADALLPIIEAHKAEVLEQIAAGLDHRESLMRASSAGNPSETWAQRDYSAAVAFGIAARIIRGQA